MNNNFLRKILKPAIRASIFLIISVAVCIYLVSRINNVSSIIEEKKTEQFLYQNSREQFAALSEDFQKIAPYVDVVNNSFPTSENILVFINAMEGLAAKHNLRQSFKFETTAPRTTLGSELGVVQFSVVLSGAQDQFLSYLADLEKMPYFTKIEFLSISSSQSGAEAQMNLRGLLYIRQ